MFSTRWSARFTFLIIGGLFPPNAFASRPTFTTDPTYLIDTWETEDGLPENSATAMAQTSDGYLWFGTFNGLVRFDGLKFNVFDPGNTPQLPSEGIVNLHVDRRGWMWVSTYRGLVVREGTQWRTFGTNDGWEGDIVRTFAERSNGDLLFTTFDGHVLEFANGRLAPLTAPPGRAGEGYFGHADEDGQWWVAQRRFVGHWDGRQWLPMLPMTNSSLETQVACGAARDGAMWLLLGQELRKYRRGSEVSRTALPGLQGGIWSLYEDRRTNVWICTYDHGLYQFSPTGELYHRGLTNGLVSESTRFVLEDRERNLWVGTSGGGLQRLKPRRFRSFGPESGLTQGHIKSVGSDASGGVWVGTYGQGLFHWREGPMVYRPLPPERNSLTYVDSVLTDRAGRTWVGSFQNGVGVLDARGFRRIDSDRIGPDVLSLFEDSRGRIWIGGTHRVSVYEGEPPRLVREHEPPAGVRCFAEDSRGVMWLSNLEGVFRLENERLEEVRDRHNQSLRDIGCIKTDANGAVFLGSRRDGLWCWRPGSLVLIGRERGLPIASVNGILEDGQGFLWMSSDRGVARVRRAEVQGVIDGTADRLQSQLFGLTDGLPSVECASGNQPTCARDTLGRLWFATLKGVAMIDPEALQLNNVAPPVHIESVVYHPPARRAALGSEPAARLEAPLPERVVLPAGSRRVEVHFTAASFTGPEKVRFQVRLEGRDTDWQDVGAQRVAYYYEIPPGNYVFRVRAANDDGIFNEAGASLRATILPLFWQTAWFRGLVAFAVLGEAGLIIVLLANRRRLHRTESELREGEQRMSLAAGAARLGLWVWEIPRDTLWINEEGRSLFGWARSEAVNFERFIASLHPDDREPTRQAVHRSLEGRGYYEAEYRVASADGATRWIAGRGQVEFNGARKPVRMRGVSIDITERKQAEEKFRLAVEASPSGIVLVNPPGRIVLVNSQTEKLFGYARQELVGQPVELLVPERFRGGHAGHRAGFFSEPQARAMGAGRELFALRKDGTEFPVEIGLSPIHSAEGILVLTVIVDIAARKQAEAEAQQQRAELAHVARVSTMGELAASVAHELNQPLAAILANAEAADLFLNQDPPALGELREILADIRQDDARAGEVIRRMRALLRRGELDQQALDVNSLVEDVFRLVSADAALRKATLSADLAPVLPKILGDRIHLEQVLLNLILNGLEAMAKQPPENRKLTVRTSRNAEGAVEVAVTDSGQGIEPDKLARVFDPFYTTKPNGMGMGLSIARRIIEAHRGRISAANNASGGATFRFALPAAGEAASGGQQGN